MHELSIALSIVDAAAEGMRRSGGGRVVAVHLRLGPLAGVVRAALESAYELAREGSPAADSVLVVEDVPLTAYCSMCAAERPIASVQRLACPDCGAPTPEVIHGRELEVVALEIEP
jgi:hydrogenase nickel incorporation protein HypA/HybF